MAKIDFKNAFWLAIPVTAAVWLVSYVFGMLGLGINQLFSSVDVTTGITPTVGNKILSFVGGVVPLNFTFPSIVITFLSAFAVLVVGSFLISTFKKLPTFKGKTGQLASTILWGAIPIYMILVGFSIPSIAVLVGLAIHTFVVAFTAGWLGGFMKKVI